MESNNQKKKTNFRQDLIQSKIITGFLEENLYKAFSDVTNILNVIGYKINKTSANDNGIDVFLKFNNGMEWKIDEKAMINYDRSQADIPTFVLEIYGWANKHNERKDGWFINNSLYTTHYLLLWPATIDKDKTYQGSDKRTYPNFENNIADIEYILVSRKKIINHLETKYDLNLETLKDAAIELISNNKKKKNLGNGLKLHRSFEKVEAPVNLVVSKEIYKEVAESFGLIPKSKI